MPSLLLYRYREAFAVKFSQVLHLLTFLLFSVGIIDMDTPQANDSEDWSRLERVVATLGVITVPGDVPRIEEREKSRAETSMENISLKEKQSQEETSNVC